MCFLASIKWPAREQHQRSCQPSRAPAAKRCKRSRQHTEVVSAERTLQTVLTEAIYGKLLRVELFSLLYSFLFRIFCPPLRGASGPHDSNSESKHRSSRSSVRWRKDAVQFVFIWYRKRTMEFGMSRIKRPLSKF